MKGNAELFAWTIFPLSSGSWREEDNLLKVEVSSSCLELVYEI